MDRLISMVHDRVEVRRVNVLSSAGQDLAWRLQVDLVPLILLYDQSGRERYRASGFRVRPAAVGRLVNALMVETAQTSKRANGETQC